MIANLHPEDIKAAIRKRYGTVRKFERENDLPEKSVSDLFRGRTSERVRHAVETAVTPKKSASVKSDASDDSSASASSHRLNQQAA
ncbi:MAG: helix-turn-helix domain-containing protein [Sandarakinorhabdus sp.]|nr:helix-turn-helix domain-containing protein [Sandarakinorhabdus sp.]